MRYLECCIKESLRLYPPVHFISRNISETVKLSMLWFHCYFAFFVVPIILNTREQTILVNVFLNTSKCFFYSLSGNYTVPAGTICHIHIYDLHRQENLFENPLEFIPERFLPEKCIGRHPYAYIPFSAGPRNCIGNFIRRSIYYRV